MKLENFLHLLNDETADHAKWFPLFRFVTEHFDSLNQAERDAVRRLVLHYESIRRTR
jgi:hypothetical protein